jgi:hypothetical protein
LRRIFVPKREEVAEVWRRLHKGERHNFYTSPNIIKVMKSRRMRSARHVARMGEMRNAYKFPSERLKGRDHSEDLGVDGNIIGDYIQKFPDWPPGARTANGTAFCH